MEAFRIGSLSQITLAIKPGRPLICPDPTGRAKSDGERAREQRGGIAPVIVETSRSASFAIEARPSRHAMIKIVIGAFTVPIPPGLTPQC